MRRLSNRTFGLLLAIVVLFLILTPTGKAAVRSAVQAVRGA